MTAFGSEFLVAVHGADDKSVAASRNCVVIYVEFASCAAIDDRRADVYWIDSVYSVPSWLAPPVTAQCRGHVYMVVDVYPGAGYTDPPAARRGGRARRSMMLHCGLESGHAGPHAAFPTAAVEPLDWKDLDSGGRLRVLWFDAADWSTAELVR